MTDHTCTRACALTSTEVADHYRVDPRTISRWAHAGRLVVVRRTPGGHFRFCRLRMELI